MAPEPDPHADGRFRLTIPTAKAGGPFKITVAGDNSVTFENVMLGEVWLCSGQSNMEWPLAATENAEAAIAGAKHPNIRLFTVENTISAHERIEVNGNWSECSPKSVGTFSAVGYYFARALQERLGAEVPIGLYNVEIKLFADGALVAKTDTAFEIVKVGFEQFVATTAQQHGFDYGLITAFMALMTGWMASIVFRKD